MKYISILLAFLLILVPFLPVSAKNYVTIATIGGLHGVDKSKGNQFMVDGMINYWDKQIAHVLPGEPDLIVLPEACDRPLGLNREEQMAYYAVRGRQVWDFFATVAKDNKCYIAFGTKHQLKDGTWRNSCVVLDRSGNLAGMYHKNFPTIGEMESGITAGTETPIIECDFGRIGCAICFDLNFEELRKRYAELKPDLMVFTSMYHGGLVQGTWAYDCRSYFVGSMGPSQVPCEIRNPLGEVIASSTNYFHRVVETINLDYCVAHLDFNWDRLTALKKKYGEKVIIHDPSKVGCVLITSEHETVSAKEMATEFDIELLDDYFKRSRDFRHKPGMME